MNPLPISVIIPTYNRATIVPRAVASALSQCIHGDEVIVVDDGSTDNTAQSLSPYEGRIRFLRLIHAGAGKARNVGVSEAQNPLIAFLDSDDEWIPGKLDLHRALMQARQDVVFSFSDLAVRDRQGREYRNYLIHWHQDSRTWDEILGPGVLFSSMAALPPNHNDFRVHTGDLYLLELLENYVSTCTLVVRRDAAGDAIHFAEDLPTYEDWECIGRLARVGPAAFLDCETVWQISGEGPRLTDANALLVASSRITVIERVWGRDPSFLERHGDLYQRTLDRVRLDYVKGLILEGRTQEARKQIALIRSTPPSVRLMARLPGSWARGLLHVRRSVRSTPPVPKQPWDKSSAEP